MMKRAGLYIHIPFCVGKCPYCGFYSKAGGEADHDRYTEAAIRAIALYPRDFEAETIYFGGGTPSIIGAERLCRILSAAEKRFGGRQDETTVEANPCAVGPEMLGALREGGFDRISFGVQSLDGRLLKVLGRRHSPQQAVSAILAAHRVGFGHISADLMLALPGQTTADIEASIEALAALPVDHLSAYILKVEEGTPFFGRHPEPDDDFAADCYQAMQQKCEALGFAQYEISNFAKNEKAKAKHNLNYWRCGEYLGIGPSAHSFMDGRRFFFKGDVEAFVSSADPWDDILSDGEGGSDEERLMLGLRTSEGVELSDFERRFAEGAARSAAPLVKAGLLKSEGGRLIITRKGYIVSNSIIAALIRGASE